MNEIINKELIKIQDELSALESAVKQVEKAESVASSVISSIKELQGKYVNHLEYIQKQVDGLFSQTGSQTEILVKDLSGKYTKQLEEVSAIFENYHNETVSAQNQNNELIKSTIEKTDSQVNELSASYNKQIEEVQSLLKNYLELAQSTATLTDLVQKIDFPKRLGNLENAAVQLNQVQVQLKTDFQIVETANNEIVKRTKKISRKSTITMIFVILTFLGVLGIMLDLHKYFPQLIEYFK
jgi:membrane-bound ClpP family serine protease